MKRMHWLVAATFPVAIVTSFSWFGVFTFVNGYLVRELGWSNEQWTAATLWLSLSMFLWYPLYAEMSSHIGRRWTVTFGMFVTTLAFTAIAAFRNPLLLKVAMAFVGSSLGVLIVAWVPYMAEVGGDKPARALAFGSLVLNLAAACALILGGRIAQPGSYVATFWAVVGACAACVVVFHLLAGRLERLLASEHKDDHASKPQTHAVSIRQLTRRDLKKLLNGPYLIILFVGICTAPFCFHTTNQLFPNLYRDVHVQSEATIATLVGFGRIPSLFTLLAISYFIDRLNKARLYGTGLLLDGLVLLGVTVAASHVAAGGAYLGFYLCHGLVWAAAFPAVDACVSRQLRDKAFALTSMVEIGAVSLVGLIHNRLLDLGQPLPAVFRLCASVTLVAGAVMLAYSWSSHWRRATSGRRPKEEAVPLDVLED
jgi:predicted MFS family arabinose efflux permease